MCGRYTVTASEQDIHETFGTIVHPARPPLAPNYNVAPRQMVPVVAYNPARKSRGLAQLRWGLVPHWSPDAKMRPVNARSETVHTNGAFSESFQQRRCLMVADGFYEWTTVGGKKLPHRFTLAGGGLFAFAGIWDVWQGEAEKLVTCCLLTTKPNELVATVHDRMPVILPPDRWGDWLQPDTPPDCLRAMLRPYDGDMDVHAASPAVNSVKNNGPELLAA